MRRWTCAGLAATATLAGMISLAPAAHAAGGTCFSAPKAGRTKAPKAPKAPAVALPPNPFAVLSPELLTCIAAQAGPVDQVNFSRVCQQWNAAAQPPMSLHNITVARTRTQLAAALANAQTSDIVIIPDEHMTIGTAPVNPHTHITIHGTKTSLQPRPRVEVGADIHVTASGYVTVWAHGSAQVTATGNAGVNADGSAQVTATGNAKVVN